MDTIKKWINEHENLWEFIKFNILSNVATITNFVVMWLCTGLVFKGLTDIPFKFWIFDYTSVESSLGLGGFLSFLVANVAAQTVNFFVQKYWVFKSNANFNKAVPKYILLAIVLIIISVALPAYSQEFFINIGVSRGLAPTLANLLNIIIQVIISYPTMKFWIMLE